MQNGLLLVLQAGLTGLPDRRLVAKGRATPGDVAFADLAPSR